MCSNVNVSVALMTQPRIYADTFPSPPPPQDNCGEALTYTYPALPQERLAWHDHDKALEANMAGKKCRLALRPVVNLSLLSTNT